MSLSTVVELPKYGLVKCGKITRANQPNAKPVLNFFGIPFAQPPIGKLRFKSPRKPKPWKGILHKTYQTCIPAQEVLFFRAAQKYLPTKAIFTQEHSSEDCLYLNIFVPENVNPKVKRPVMVWFYGGAFQMGPNSFLDGTALAGMNDVIVVVPNYRVNMFGFLSSGSFDNNFIEGNFALLDQLECLKWLNENVEHFGGDPNNVTIFGESAGGISVNFQMMSPLSKGYFHKAISHSGVATCTKTFQVDQKRGFLKLLEVLNIDAGNDSDAILKQLQALDTDELIKANTQLLLAGYQLQPTLDNIFIKDTPLNLLAKGNLHAVPYILGCNNSEGGHTMNLVNPNYLKGLTKQEYFEKGNQLLRWYNKWWNKNIDPRKALPVLLKQYTKDMNESDKMLYSKAGGEILANIFFVLSITDTANKYSDEGHPTFVYHLTHALKLNHDPEFGPITAHKPPFVEADHTDDIIFTWGIPFMDYYLKGGFKFSGEEETLSRQMMTYFTNFAKSGNPNIVCKIDLEWPLYERKKQSHIVLKCPLSISDKFAAENVQTYDHVAKL